MLFVYPFVAFIAACARRYHGGDAVRAGYREQLLFPQVRASPPKAVASTDRLHCVSHLIGPVPLPGLPVLQDWFSYWRLNCRLASWHAHVTESPDFRMEDKWTFLKCGDEQQVPISPFDKVTPSHPMAPMNETTRGSK